LVLYAYLCMFAHSHFVENLPIWSWETNPSFLRWFCHNNPAQKSLTFHFFHHCNVSRNTVSATLSSCKYSASKINAPIPNLTTYHRVLLVTVPSCDYASEQDLEPSGLFCGFLLLLNSDRELSPPFNKTSFLEKFGGFVTSKPSCHPRVWNLADLSPRASLSKVVAGIAPFLPSLRQIEYIQCNLDGERNSSIAIDHFQWPLLGHCLLEVYLAPHTLLAIK
jgi:hypothetical protein